MTDNQFTAGNGSFLRKLLEDQRTTDPDAFYKEIKLDLNSDNSLMSYPGSPEPASAEDLVEDEREHVVNAVVTTAEVIPDHYSPDSPPTFEDSASTPIAEAQTSQNAVPTISYSQVTSRRRKRKRVRGRASEVKAVSLSNELPCTFILPVYSQPGLLANATTTPSLNSSPSTTPYSLVQKPYGDQLGQQDLCNGRCNYESSHGDGLETHPCRFSSPTEHEPSTTGANLITNTGGVNLTKSTTNISSHAHGIIAHYPTTSGGLPTGGTVTVRARTTSRAISTHNSDIFPCTPVHTINWSIGGGTTAGQSDCSSTSTTLTTTATVGNVINNPPSTQNLVGQNQPEDQANRLGRGISRFSTAGNKVVENHDINSTSRIGTAAADGTPTPVKSLRRLDGFGGSMSDTLSSQATKTSVPKFHPALKHRMTNKSQPTKNSGVGAGAVLY